MLYLQNNVVYSFSLTRLLFAQRIFRFYEKAEVPLPPNYLGIGFWPDAFLCPKSSSEDSKSEDTDTSTSSAVTGQRYSPERALRSGYRDHGA